MQARHHSNGGDAFGGTCVPPVISLLAKAMARQFSLNKQYAMSSWQWFWDASAALPNRGDTTAPSVSVRIQQLHRT